MAYGPSESLQYYSGRWWDLGGLSNVLFINSLNSDL
jgi:hypothetical protein